MSPSEATEQPELIRGVGLAGATTLNMIDMIGVGPFITIPLIVSAAGGPQAMLGWIAGAVFALCDGLIWAELGAAMPNAGGSYQYLKQAYGPNSMGRLLSFLFIWQLSFSAPLSIASGCIGLAHYAGYIWPGLDHTWLSHTYHLGVPLLGSLDVSTVLMSGTLVAMASCAFIVFLLYRRITVIAKLAELLWVGVAIAIAWIIFAGLTHFNAARAFDFPPGAFTLSPEFFTGMGAAMLIATYDYWGYYNVCFLGGEVKDPARTIPRALIISIVVVAAIYIVMNISVLGVIPWREMTGQSSAQNNYIVSVFMERIYGHWAGRAIAALIIWTAFASVFSLLLGYSRVPYAAALDGKAVAATVLADLHGRSPASAAGGTEPAERPAAHGVAVVAAAPLRWVAPGRITDVATRPPRGRFVLWADEFRTVPRIEVRQGDRLLAHVRSRNPLVANRPHEIGSGWLAGVDLGGPDVVVSLR